ncbi:uncharacterized protein LOC123610563 isoform X2 [Leopardus geoffroyi]|uniref:uncharacterized protein LOC123610563 isoform X1 n=1 Tax=Leopardus geoffroyi TaxID=46844 RepID=UPI001E261737|nr:uncharacterized protein LOC123610563 isoform X1 [Leopardus geoffroyi]XP_045357293.1 uncharacterized protein LOC123610563 isoform X2 [Leopardus geoffroyi]
MLEAALWGEGASRGPALQTRKPRQRGAARVSCRVAESGCDPLGGRPCSPCAPLHTPTRRCLNPGPRLPPGPGCVAPAPVLLHLIPALPRVLGCRTPARGPPLPGHPICTQACCHLHLKSSSTAFLDTLFPSSEGSLSVPSAAPPAGSSAWSYTSSLLLFLNQMLGPLHQAVLSEDLCCWSGLGSGSSCGLTAQAVLGGVGSRLPSFQDAWCSWFSPMLAPPVPSTVLVRCWLYLQTVSRSPPLPTASLPPPAQAPPLAPACLLPAAAPACSLSGPTTASCGSAPKTASRAPFFENTDQSISWSAQSPPEAPHL